MAKRGKKYLEFRKKLEGKEQLELAEAISILRDNNYTKFDETVDVIIRLGVNPKHSDQMVRGTVVLPHGTGKTKKVCVIASGEKIKEAEEAGADYVGGEELIEKISKGWTEFDAVIAAPDMMRGVGKLGRILGPRGLMPNPKTGTVTFEIQKAIEEIKSGRIEFRMDKTGIVHAGVGKLSFTEDKIAQNVKSFISAILQAKPPAAKGKYIRSIHLASTMSPSIKISESILEK